jgi:hypothetical protein
MLINNSSLEGKEELLEYVILFLVVGIYLVLKTKGILYAEGLLLFIVFSVIGVPLLVKSVISNFTKKI